mmetsp:Transcript_75732/g.227324  ORF Transcript_75732/g.227324 Transcript_75732/m.227324 type:complete len:576 (+) Transcript_75732:67-1794(+)
MVTSRHPLSVPAGITRQIWLAIVFGCIGMLLFGYDTGVVSGAMVLVADDLNLTNQQQEQAVSVTTFFAAVSCLLAAPLTSRFGRRLPIAVAAMLYLAGSLLCGLATDFTGLFLGRLILGLGIGLSSVGVPMFTSELAPSDVRGLVVTIGSASIVVGQVVASLANVAFQQTYGGWRLAFGIAAVPAFIQLPGVFLLPESPRWLCQVGRTAEAELTLKRLRETEDVQAELDEILGEEQLTTGGDRLQAIRELWSNRVLRRSALLGIGLQMLNQLSGINTIMYYSATILRAYAGFHTSAAIWLALLCTFGQLAGNVISLFLMDHGRRATILPSAAVVFFALLALSFGFFVLNFVDPASGGAGLARIIVRRAPPLARTLHRPFAVERSTHPHFQPDFPRRSHRAALGAPPQPPPSVRPRALPVSCKLSPLRRRPFSPPAPASQVVVGLMAYLIAFGAGMSAVPLVYTSEIYPMRVRSAGVSQAMLAQWLTNGLVSITFLSLSDTITTGGTFAIFATLSGLGWLWIYIYAPETAGVPLEHIEKLFSDPYPRGLRRERFASLSSLLEKPTEETALKAAQPA